jgi:putative IMPACT (imprinted ancient) family translation regulator
MAIDAATFIPWVEMTQLALNIEYSQLQMLEYQLKKIHGQILQQDFSDKVNVIINLPSEHKVAIQQQFNQ